MSRRKRRRSKLSFQQVGRTRKESLLLTFSTVIYFIAAIFWLELSFHFVMFDSFSWNFLYPILFAIPFGAFFGLLCNLTPSKMANYVITCALTFLCCLIYGANIVYKGVFQTFLGVFSMVAKGNAGKAFGFGPFLELAIKTIGEQIFGIILILIPFLFILTIGRTLLSYRQRKWPMHAAIAGGVVIVHLLLLLIIGVGSRDAFSVYDLYHNNSSLEESVEKLGIATSMRLDLKNVLFGTDKDLNLELEDEGEDWQSGLISGDKDQDAQENTGADGETVMETESEPETEPDPHDLFNFVDIDFDTLIAEAEAADNSNLLKMHKYFNSLTPTATNEYTGIYEGYNLIFITAEGFSPYAVDEKLTPTLYKMINTGYVFNNFYTPLWYGSTNSGEYVNLISQYPMDGEFVSLQETGKRGTDMYFSMGRIMERAGYRLWGFHNNDYAYYGRDKSHPNMGYEWIGTYNGYEPETGSSGKALWPQSDEYLVNTTFDKFVSNEPFHVYYLTVSGHVQYNFAGNAMSIRNKEAVADLPLSDTAKAYIACNIELDKAMESLLNKLETAGIADNTLVVLVADHIPYDNIDMCHEIYRYKNGITDENYRMDETFELYRNNLIIWTGSMKETVYVDKVCSSVDVLPTIANMLGVEYDSRILMGRDIFSDEEGLVVFNRRHWITDTAMYNNSTKEVISRTGAEISEDYVSSMKKKVSNKLAISRMIIDMDYYSYLHD